MSDDDFGPEPRPPETILGKKRAIAARYAKKASEQRRRGWWNTRKGALTKVFGARYGDGKLYQLPDDDAGREDLRIVLDHFAYSNPLAIPRVIKARAPWLTDDERESMLDLVAREARFWSSPALAEALNLTEAERVQLGGVRTIGAIDVTPEQREKARRDRYNEKRRQKRRVANVQTREQWLATNSNSRTSPG